MKKLAKFISLFIVTVPFVGCSTSPDFPFEYAYDKYLHDETVADKLAKSQVSIKKNDDYYEYVDNEWIIVDNTDRVGYPVNDKTYGDLMLYNLYKENDLKEVMLEVLDSIVYPDSVIDEDHKTEYQEVQLCFRNLDFKECWPGKGIYYPEIYSNSDTFNVFANSLKRELPKDVTFYVGDMVKLIYVGELVIDNWRYVEDYYDVVKIINLGNKNRRIATMKLITNTVIKDELYFSLSFDEDDGYILYNDKSSFRMHPRNDVHRDALNAGGSLLDYTAYVSRRCGILFGDDNDSTYGKLPRYKKLTDYNPTSSSEFQKVYGVYDGLKVSVIVTDIYDKYNKRYFCWGAHAIDYEPEGKELGYTSIDYVENRIWEWEMEAWL